MVPCVCSSSENMKNNRNWQVKTMSLTDDRNQTNNLAEVTSRMYVIIIYKYFLRAIGGDGCFLFFSEQNTA